MLRFTIRVTRGPATGKKFGAFNTREEAKDFLASCGWAPIGVGRVWSIVTGRQIKNNAVVRQIIFEEDVLPGWMLVSRRFRKESAPKK